MKKLTHIDKEGRVKMVDVTEKPSTEREAITRGSVGMKPETLKLIQDKKVLKGDVLCVARVAGIMAAKKTSELIPMCDPLNITSVSIDFNLDNKKNKIDIEACVKVTHPSTEHLHNRVWKSSACEVHDSQSPQIPT